MNIMDSIEYGFKDENGKNLMVLGGEKWNERFPKVYRLQTLEELYQFVENERIVLSNGG